MNLKDIQQQLEEGINSGANSVEGFHRQFADSVFTELQKFDKIAAPVAELKETHDRLIGSLYDLVRSLNQKSGEAVRSVVDKGE